MSVPPKDGVSRPCGGMAPDFKCDQMATFRSTGPQKDARADEGPGTGSSTGPTGPQPEPPKHPGWCCPLGHFEAAEPPKI